MKSLHWLFLVCLFLSCDGGLTPPPEFDPGFGGTITFESWPSTRDSLVNVWLFASQIYPLDSIKIFEGLFTTRKIFLYPGLTRSLPFNVDSVTYSFAPLEPGRYLYIGIIQQFNSDINIRSFRVVGFYKNPADTLLPGEVEVRDFTFITGIHLHAHFRNPPPQPF